ncbi:tRNA (N6-isopentenyl adenosine(37)-C2)-methylthiotransferase MiaB [Agrobacterium sp. CMT1]|jgi:tRNA-2-methylthio-N6-dimethylallyladenosine synthase|uniref:tRNA-2-methylthio-N(6)-dimethylallyladenosine synthase n=2 Tax=Agrobacterium pusense TaxID=648995 RepID=U4PQ24_9HYPH|nr:MULTISPECIES: tRNA (N6-isopentenyl adenosine(37)-C2)-methylthiotransferase MiaB [Rhizobium/Agrobacterium group]AMD60683.1 tRNA-2-methylthio-N(6)-dimethylallyladenosine synthase MiaB [Agrobacterium tumefaciens]ANV24314.1 tRNA (N6-isopentenyl adenosine(37)-C2)-methylthiotransferase MiaB [Rhizobium sp. S41]KGE84084.1 (dimethylallyl)adenosine tRNA methylthiotransferase [Rhizobium sp. H41]MBB2903938.1 tRNA-2-methylthio-N6-dimethylallyladenosine synthase [Rhizobium sp. RAS22]KAJ37151.1 (dimethyla
MTQETLGLDAPPMIAREGSNSQPASIARDGANSRKVFIKTYGCQMNVYDSVRMSDALAKDGYVQTEDMGEADLVLLNTCHIREKAAEKVYSALGRLRDMKKSREEQGREFMIGVAGCVAQAEGEEILRRAPAVDVVIGPQTYHRLPEALKRVRGGERVIETEYAVEDKFEHLPVAEKSTLRTRGVTAFLTVQEGCDKFCTFCVVPYTRGSEVSRPVRQIVDEAMKLVDAGVREITLLGQNVNAWQGEGPKGEKWGLAELLYRLAEIPGLARLRYTTSHPRDMDDRLIGAHRDLRILMPYLHLPVQSGSDRILKAMNRRHTGEEYIQLIEKIRAARPDIAMSGDFIVGFPGETDRDFEDTMAMVETVKYAQAFSFKYSTRPGTPGADLTDQVAEDVKAERLERLQALLLRQQKEFAESLVGKTMDVLLEKPGRMTEQLIGRSPWLQSVNLDAKTLKIGDIVNVRITATGPNSLFAEVAES